MLKLLFELLFIFLIFAANCSKNNPPDKPATPAGPNSGGTDIAYDFSSTADDPDGDNIAIRFFWGLDDTSDWSSFVQSGGSVSISHSWSDTGIYYIKAQAKDKKGTISDWSDSHSIIIVENSPPNTPPVPSGPSSGRKDSVYSFAIATIDPNNDSICYRFDWGNGDTSEWSVWVSSGYPVAMAHSWLQTGTYLVKAQAKDKKGAISNWSAGHSILIMENYPPNSPPNTPTTPLGPYFGFKDSVY
ncbi:MAG: PKD domain-containing protein, partial [candidate division WOR-3 bacterium]